MTIGKMHIQADAKVLTQKILDSYNSGVQIETIQLQDVNPPGPVKEAFNDVNAAKQNKSQAINQAWEEYNKVIPEAKGEAEQMLKQAEAYKVDKINRAKGDAAKFLKVLAEYKKAKDITEKRLYLETLEEMLGKVESLHVIDKDVKGVLNMLDITGKQGGKK